MSAPYNALQQGIYNALTGHSALITALGGSYVYDHVPQGHSGPYVAIGEDTSIEDDSKTHNGWEFTCTIHSWDSSKAGRKSIKTIMSHVYDALHKNEGAIIVPGFNLVLMSCEYSEPIQETAIEGENDHYYHGVQRFRAIVTEV